MVIFLASMLMAVSSFSQTQAEIAALKTAVEDDLVNNLLPFWGKTVDPNGGFYGVVTVANEPVPEADKGSILNARILWTYARAYRYNPLEEYKEKADRAAEYFIAHFIDPKYGGVYWTVDAEGHPKDMTKQTYAASFGIYGLAEHFRATGDVRSLEAAKAIYRTIEERVHDKARLGYQETFLRDYTTGSIKGVDGQEGATKTMNTHIHLLEAYTTLYLVWQDAELRANLLELIDILQTRLYSPDTKHLILFCNNDWLPIGQVDSYGHDIETSWLLTEAAEALGDEQMLKNIRKQSVEMVETALREGMDAEGFMRYEKVDGVMNSRLSWWPQCETVIGCINAWQITGKKKYFDAAVRTWNYINKHFIDHANGGWFMILADDATPVNEPKASLWNCPYHNSRMAYELAMRLRWPSTHSEVMAWSNITGVRVEGELVDFESSLRIGNPAGKMEVTARERQSPLQYKREGNTQITVTPMHGAQIMQQVTDQDMQTVLLNWHVEAKENLKETAYFCMDFAPKNYAAAKISASGKKITVKANSRKIEITFSRSVKMFINEENGHKVVYVTLLQELKKGTESTLSAVMKVGCTPDHEEATIHINPSKPGRMFAGFGGNFRIQNVKKDPQVIDYCLSHMRVAFGRVEFPWARWDKEGAQADHIRRSAEMARTLKAQGMPVIVSCWFPPEWAGVKTTRSDGSAVAYSLRQDQKERIFESMTDYLLFLKREYGVEADYFSFNESDLGIDVVFTPEEHRDFIKEFGQYMANKGLKTLMLLGDNSDATTFDFILPTLNDPSAHKYVGAVSFHSWRGCDDETLQKWAAAARQMNVPLIVGEGSTDAAAHRYPAIFNETTFALYEINLYTRLCAICQPMSILQWQLTSDYSLLWGDGIYGSDGPMRPTQRFFNIRQLSLTPADAFAVPAEVSKDNVNVAAFVKPATGESCVHIVNNAASCKAHITGIPAGTESAVVLITNQYQHGEASIYAVHDGCLDVDMPADSFVSVFITE